MTYEPCDHEAERTISGSIILCFEGGNGIQKYICHWCIIIIYHVYTNKEHTLQR